ncbi:MAG: gamma-glutamyl-gamma-aminobutyrate hydrolase family protein [Micrococcaceae bacterium]|nr:gamma-glutamyl-gamma-aminobutyrate hydrolase family protein [Micrococcaceae bacterium]
MSAQTHPGLNRTDYQLEQDFVEDARPAIGVVVALWSREMSQSDAQTMHDLIMTTVATIRDAGGRPIVIDGSAQTQQAENTAWHKDVDAFVYLGGADVHPGFFTDVELSEQVPGIDAQADQFAVASLRQAVADDAPVLGICRGAQLLNVALGGSIVQHIDGHRSVLDNGDTGFIDENVDLVADSKIAKILGRATVRVRSSHHQTIDEVGDELVVTAYAQDDSIEAVELPEKTWVVGLQWHPEEAHANAEDRRKIFEALIEQTK